MWLISSVRWITVVCHFHYNDLMPVISCLMYLTFCSLFYVISILFYQKTYMFSYICHYCGTLLLSYVNRKYSSNVPGCLSYLKKQKHYKVTKCFPLSYIMTYIRSLLWKWHNTVIPLTANFMHTKCADTPFVVTSYIYITVILVAVLIRWNTSHFRY